MIISSCLFCPNGRNAVYIAPIIIAVCFLFVGQIIAVIIHVGGSERRIVGTDVDLTDACLSVGNNYTCKRITNIKCTITDALYAIGDNDTRKGTATSECIISNICHAIRNINIC